MDAMFRKPRIRCGGCSKWYEPEWIYHPGHPRETSCRGLFVGEMRIPEPHMVTVCECGSWKIRLLTKEESEAIDDSDLRD